MKTYRLLFFILISAVLCSCFKDETNTDYHPIDRPILVSPNWSDDLTGDSREFEAALGQRLQIPTTIQYKDMSDLSYRWVIDSVLVSTDKDLDWVVDMDKSKVSGIFYIRRNSAGNEEVFSFSVKLLDPYQRAFCILAKGNDGQLKYHFLSETYPAYTYTMINNVTGGSINFNKPIKTTEFFSCGPKSTTMGELEYIDEDPTMCFSMNGKSLMTDMPLTKEFIGDEIPENLRIKDIMYQGFVSYILGDDGKLYFRRSASGYYTGRFSSLPVRYKNKELNVQALVPAFYKNQYCMVYEYDNTANAGRFLLVNTAYVAQPANGSTLPSQYKNAGVIAEFDNSTNLTNIPNKELIYSQQLQGLSGYPQPYPFWMLFKDKSDGKCYAREFYFSFKVDQTIATDFTEVYTPTYQVMDDIDETCPVIAMTNDVNTYYFYNSAFTGKDSKYVFYANKNDKSKLMVRQRGTNSLGAAVEFHDFDSEIVSLATNKTTATVSLICIGFADGSVIVYRLAHARASANPWVDFTTYSADRVIYNSADETDEEKKDLGEIINISTKYGFIANSNN